MAGRAAFLLPNMAPGGAERLTADLVNGFAARGAEVDLVLMQAEGEFLNLLDPRVRVVDLKVTRLRSVPCALRAYLREARPAALIAAMWPLTTLAVVAAARLAVRPRLLLADHATLLGQYAKSSATLFALRATIRASYSFADGLIGVSRGVATEIAALAELPPDRVTTIYNPIPPPLRSGGPDPWGSRKGKRVIAVGNLKDQKNHALLIDAFARAAIDDAELAIVGSGPLRDALDQQAVRLGLADRVRLPGFTQTPGDWYAGADLFVLSSDYEGFGNVLVEAMHHGLPVISTDCRHGPAEILGDGRWGRLVPVGDAAALAQSIREVLQEPVDAEAQRGRAGEYTVKRAVEDYWRMAFGGGGKAL